jgi:hypothetical protein
MEGVHAQFPIVNSPRSIEIRRIPDCPAMAGDLSSLVQHIPHHFYRIQAGTFVQSKKLVLTP